MKYEKIYIIILLLLTISCSKKQSSEEDTNNSMKSDSLTLSKKKDIKDFWAYYRQATKSRIAGSWQEAVEGYIKALELNRDH